MSKGQIVKVKVIECGAHGCANADNVRNTKHAKELGWRRTGGNQYGWICPGCANRGTETSND